MLAYLNVFGGHTRNLSESNSFSPTIPNWLWMYVCVCDDKVTYSFKDGNKAIRTEFHLTNYKFLDLLNKPSETNCISPHL